MGIAQVLGDLGATVIADSVVVPPPGRALGGLYAELYQRQFQAQEPAVAQLSP